MPNNVTEREIVLKKKIKRSLTAKKSPYKKDELNEKKNQPDKGKELPLLCTECGKELDFFWLKDMASDNNAIKANFENCKKTGKFKGHYCSKMFISSVYPDKVLKKKK